MSVEEDHESQQPNHPVSPGESPSSNVPDVRSWAFWKKRLARLLVMGALGLAATQILPALPEDQTVEIRMREGRLTKLRLTYYEGPETAGEPLVGTDITLAEPGRTVPHRLRLKNGEYVLKIEALQLDESDNVQVVRKTKQIELTGEKIRISLD